jgi:hypothetical protein
VPRVLCLCRTSRQYLAFKHEPTRDEVASAVEDVNLWLSSLKSSSSSSSSSAAASKESRHSRTGDDEWTEKEKAFAAVREKQKGNDAFRANELELAVKHYTRSLELVPDSAIVLSNRCVTRPCARGSVCVCGWVWGWGWGSV